LPTRDGLGAAWIRTPDRGKPFEGAWATMREWLEHKIPDRLDVGQFLAEQRFVYQDGSPVAGDDAYQPHTFVWFHRDLPVEAPVPGTIHIVHRDERLVVIDKPAFLSSIPRGQHVRESVVVKLRDELGLPELTPAHRLDRVTSGLLMLATERQWRGPYQSMFANGTVKKTYWALAKYRPDLALPVTVTNHLNKRRGSWQVDVVDGAPVNAETLVELERVLGDVAIYRLTPRTGRTHQLRAHLSGLGIPMVGDPLYPEVLDVAIDDFSQPLQLLAGRLEFTDPIDGTRRVFTSQRTLPLKAEV
jgi:tRNA pseudouridine32 synthase/23S rRNA pseudouridine746 synthase